MAEAFFLVQPWTQAKTAMDCCKLCFQERGTKAHLECKRAHLSAYNSLLSVVKLEKGQTFEDAYAHLNEAKEKCLATVTPDEHCHTKSQGALKQTVEIYDRILDDFKKRLPNRMPSTPR